MPEGLFSKVVRMIWMQKAVKFDLKYGFDVKHLKDFPDVDKPPIYLNLRPVGEGGTLCEEDFDLLAMIIVENIEKAIKEYHLKFDAICGIPKAGVYIIDAIRRVAPWFEKKYRIVELDKVGLGSERRITLKEGFQYKKGERILLIDDVVSWATSSKEAIAVLLSAGSIPVGVIFYLDRQEGGKELLERMGYVVLVCNTMDAMLSTFHFMFKMDLEPYYAYKKYAQKARLLLDQF
jgi:orotate phosphoribosyltransferase